jgi:hypothetical protein
MKKIQNAAVVTCVLLFAIATALVFTKARVAARPVRLVIIAPEGQRFSGTYVADGVTNSVNALAPATISMSAKDVAFEFTHERTNAQFRVELFVGQLCRTSTTGEKNRGVRGALRYAADKESYWASAF